MLFLESGARNLALPLGSLGEAFFVLALVLLFRSTVTFATSFVVGAEPLHPPSYLGHSFASLRTGSLPRGERLVARRKDENRIV